MVLNCLSLLEESNLHTPDLAELFPKNVWFWVACLRKKRGSITQSSCLHLPCRVKFINPNPNVKPQQEDRRFFFVLMICLNTSLSKHQCIKDDLIKLSLRTEKIHFLKVYNILQHVYFAPQALFFLPNPIFQAQMIRIEYSNACVRLKQ